MSIINVNTLQEYFLIIDSEGDVWATHELSMEDLEEEGVIIQVLYDRNSGFTTSRVIAK